MSLELHVQMVKMFSCFWRTESRPWDSTHLQSSSMWLTATTNEWPSLHTLWAQEQIQQFWKIWPANMGASCSKSETLPPTQPPWPQPWGAITPTSQKASPLPAPWTEPYEDAFGFGRLVTVSMPVYYQEGGVRKILGVVGIEVQYSQIEFGMSEQEVISLLISNAPVPGQQHDWLIDWGPQGE